MVDCGRLGDGGGEGGGGGGREVAINQRLCLGVDEEANGYQEYRPEEQPPSTHHALSAHAEKW